VTHPEAQQYEAEAPALIAAANVPTRTALRQEFGNDTVDAFLHDSGYSGLADMLRFFSGDSVRAMLSRFAREVAK
jgi:hypothetical protein